MKFTLLLHGYDKDGKRVGVWETPRISFDVNGCIDFDYKGGYYTIEDRRASHTLRWMLRHRARICTDLFVRPVKRVDRESADRTHAGMIREIYDRFERNCFDEIVPYEEAHIVSIVVMGINDVTP